MTPPETRYAKSGDVHIAYQVVGSGRFDLVYVPGFVSNMDLQWEMPEWARFYSRLTAFSRLILFDKRGTGLLTAMSASPRSRSGWTTSGRSWTLPARSARRCLA